ncbi:metallophosphoesterase [Candidatus Woesearchaeota archaeon]|nr:metallophosphoesterase [Candidatus Woesearchaeota archaeon]
MQIYENIEIIDICLYLKKEKILVIGDMHIGLEEALNKQGILIPRQGVDEVIKRLKKILDKIEIKEIILIGDVKHEFGTISDQEWRDTLNVLDFLLEKRKVILIKGNHDTILGPISKKRNLEIKEFYKVNKILFVHGDKIINEKSEVIIIGHEHPAISFEERRDEKYKCFLLGKHKKSKLIVIPSFNLLVEGSDVTKEKTLSPYIENIKKFRVFISENNKVRDFGLLRDLK